MKSMLSALAVVLVLSSTASAQFRRSWNGSCYVYQPAYAAAYYTPSYCATPYCAAQAAAVVRERQTTVVNNLIGIPVPVQYNQPIAAQGNTVYGYSSVAETYGSMDLGLLYNQAARLTDQAQQLAGQAATDFQSLVQAEGQNRAEVAKIIAQGQAARDALLAARPTAIAQNQQFRAFTFRVVQDAQGQMRVERVDAAAGTASPDFSLSPATTGAKTNLSDIIKSRCLACHSGSKVSGGLNFTQAITDAQQRRVLELITSADSTKRMPKNGPPLTVDETNAFFQEMGTPTQSAPK